MLLDLGGLEIRWYGVLYVVAFAVAWWLLPRLQRYRNLKLSRDEWLYVIAWGVVGVVIGGRLGYVVLYELGYYLQHPVEIVAVWQGGMSSHGGFIGVGFALWQVARKLKIDLLALADVLIVPAALGLAFGRIGNLINRELYLSAAVNGLVIGKNLLIAAVAFWHLKRGPKKPGGTVALFLILYGVLRFVTEYGRVQEWPAVFGMTRGQLFTLPIIVGGGLLWVWIGRQYERQ